jgi:hypothetical protein
MATEKPNLPAGSTVAEDALSGEATPPRTGDSTPTGQNPDRPAIGPMGGYTPNSPAEAAGGKTSTFLEPSDRPLAEVLDETDREYLQEALQQGDNAQDSGNA